MKIIRFENLTDAFYVYKEIEEIDSVREIIADVRRRGDKAVREYTLKFDGVDPDDFLVDASEMIRAYETLGKNFIRTMESAADNIRQFAEKQKESLRDFAYEIQPGVVTGQNIIPIEKVGVYAPGGGYPLSSTVLMCAIPARVAGVESIALCSPPTQGGSIHPAILAAAKICGVDRVYRVGGVQSIAAMAYGTETIHSVDKIVGPGNRYVTAAKKTVYGAVGIDFIAGPTELLIIADASADPVFIAADLLGQAEHDIHASPILITTSQVIADRVMDEIGKQLIQLSTAKIALEALHRNGLIIRVDTLDQAIDIANRKAPEHLELQIQNAEVCADRMRNYGTLFIGSLSAEALGDYSSGLNHTLPTNGCARYTGGLSVRDFLKFQTMLRVTEEGLSAIASTAMEFGRMEGLQAHANSIAVRVKSKREK